ncbi:MAG: alpha/beta fold hydrolase [Verrucomicrobiales bacterium]|nr:alpha/beta fold hydrolase [Verrucomicrobiales bacterium]
MATLHIDDGDLYFELHEGHSNSGRSPARVLWIQGVGVAGSGWGPQIEGLGAEFSHLVFDNRGLGRSQPWRGPISIKAMAEDAKRLMDHLGWKSAHIAGHSMGGVISQEFALRFPDRVQSLSLLCTFPRGRDAARPTPWVLWMSLRTWVGTRAMRRRAFLEMLVPPSDLVPARLDSMAHELSKIIGRDLAHQPPIMLRQVQALAKHDVSGELSRLGSIPTLVISAELDPIAPPRYGRRLASLIPGSQYLQLPGASHAVTIHSPNQVNQPLQRFLAAADQVPHSQRSPNSQG